FRSGMLDQRSVLDPGPANLVAVLIVLIFSSGLALVLFIVWCGGFVLSARSSLEHLLSTELLLRGRIFDRPVRRSIAVGLIAASLIGAVTYLFAARGLVRSPDMLPVMPAFFVASMPALSHPAYTVCLTLFILFGFVAPLARAYIKRATLAHLLWLVVG